MPDIKVLSKSGKRKLTSPVVITFCVVMNGWYNLWRGYCAKQ